MSVIFALDSFTFVKQNRHRVTGFGIIVFLQGVLKRVTVSHAVSTPKATAINARDHDMFDKYGIMHCLLQIAGQREWLIWIILYCCLCLHRSRAQDR